MTDFVRPRLRQEALRRGLGLVQEVVSPIDGVAGLAALGTLNFKTAVQIVDFFPAWEYAGEIIEALPGSRTRSEYAARRRRWKRRLVRNGVKGLGVDSRREAAQFGRAEGLEARRHYSAQNVDRCSMELRNCCQISVTM